MKLIGAMILWCGLLANGLCNPLEVQVESTGELKVIYDGQHIGTNQVYVELIEDQVTYGQSLYHKRMTDVEISQEGDEYFIVGNIPGVASLLERVSVSGSIVRFNVSLKFESDARVRVYSNYSLYGLEAPFDQVKVSDDSNMEINLSPKPESTASESKIFIDQHRIGISPPKGVAYELKSSDEVPIFLSDARGGGGFFYIGILPPQDGNVSAESSLSYSYEVSVKK